MPHPATNLPHPRGLPLGHPFVELKSVDSTNNYATALVQSGSVSHGAAFFAHEQFAGKGQRGKTWTSTPGENIIMSLVLKPGEGVSPGLSLTQQFPLSVCVALACHDFFSRYALPEETFIKWPNDLYWRDRKAGGILIENGIRGTEWLYAIVGIGININQTDFPPGLGQPVSLRQVTGRSFHAVELARELTQGLDQRYHQWLRGETAIQLKDYNERLYKRGAVVTLRKGQVAWKTTVGGVNERGELLVRDSLERSFSKGEVEWVL